MRYTPRFAHVLAVAGIVFSSAAFGQEESVLSKPNRVAPSEVSPASFVEGTQVSQGNDLFLAQWIRLDASSNVSGSVVRLTGADISNVSKARVSLLQGGNVVAYDDTDIDGGFSIEHVSPGYYSLVARSDSGIAVFSLTVLDAVSGSHLPAKVQIPLLSPVTNRVTELLYGQSLPAAPAIGSNYAPSTDPLRMVRTFAPSHQVLLDSQGGVAGRFTLPFNRGLISGTSAYLFKDGNEIARTTIAPDGSYRFSGVNPGIYGIVASGTNGYAAFSFQAVRGEVASNVNVKSKLVSFQSGPSNSLNVELSGVPGVVETTPPGPPAPPEDMAGVPFGPGFGGGPGMGGGFGGGGGLAGGRGLGGLAALGAIGGLTAAAIVAANHNNNNPVSPVGP